MENDSNAEIQIGRDWIRFRLTYEVRFTLYKGREQERERQTDKQRDRERENELLNKRHGICGYMSKITVKHRHEQVKVIVIGKRSSWESIPQKSRTPEEAA